MTLSDDDIKNLADKPLVLVVVGPTNVGKTSLVRTLTRKTDFGKVSNNTGIAVEAMGVPLDLADQNLKVMKIVDTPGFDDLDAAQQSLGMNPTAKAIKEFFVPGTAQQQLCAIIDELTADRVAFYVIDPSLPPLPDHSYHLMLLRTLGVPVIPVFHRFTGKPPNRLAWENAVTGAALQNDIVDIDARVFEPEHEEQLYKAAWKRLANGSLHQRFVSYWIDSKAEKRQDRLNQAASVIQCMAKDLIASKQTKSNVAPADAVGIQARLTTEILDNEKKTLEKAENDLKGCFGFDENNKIEDEDGKSDGDILASQGDELLGSQKWSYGAIGGAILLGLGVTVDVMSAGFSMGLGTVTALAVVGITGGVGVNARYDAKNKIVQVELSSNKILHQVERMLRLVQRLHFSGAAAVTDGTLDDNRATIKLGSYRLDKDLRKKFEAMLPDSSSKSKQQVKASVTDLWPTHVPDLDLKVFRDAVAEAVNNSP